MAALLRTVAGRRALAIGLALLIEALLLLVLLSFSAWRPSPGEEVVRVSDLKVYDLSEESPEPVAPKAEQRAAEQPLPRPRAEQPPAQPAEPVPQLPAQPMPVPTPPAILPSPNVRPPAPDVPRAAPQTAPSAGRVYGPVDTGGSPSSRDTERVGTAPNGEPLYAAAWHRQPRPDELRAYLSTARGPGWGLIACRTAPNYRVQDCVPLDEYPQGSQINRAILAAAWEFEVRPPRRGGRLLVGSWVRIRIDYRIGR